MNKKKTPGKKNIVGKWFIFIVALLSVAGYTMHNYLMTPEQSEDYNYAFTKHGELVFITPAGSDTLTSIDIEIAGNEASREMGLMYRQSMPDNMGMLFIFDRDEMRSFWMKHTFIPLDLLFINADFEIVTIRENNKPLIEWSIQSDAPARYVLEVNAGFCVEHGIQKGHWIRFNRTLNQ